MKISYETHPRNYEPSVPHLNIFFVGGIDNGFAENVRKQFTDKNTIEVLERAHTKKEKLILDIYIDSGGGDLGTATLIREAILNLVARNDHIEPITHASGNVCSAGIVLLGLGRRRVLYQNTYMLFHGVSGQGSGRPTEGHHERLLAEIKDKNNYMKKMYLSSGFNKQEVEKLFKDPDKNIYLNHEKIIKADFCTHVIEDYIE